MEKKKKQSFAMGRQLTTDNNKCNLKQKIVKVGGLGIKSNCEMHCGQDKELPLLRSEGLSVVVRTLRTCIYFLYGSPMAAGA